MMKYCTAAVGSMTSALKAHKALSSASILSNIVKINNSNTHRGCSYGLEFDYSQYYNVQFILKSYNINVSEYIMGGDHM